MCLVGATRAGGRGRRLAEAEPAQEADGGRGLPQHAAQQTEPQLRQEGHAQR